MNLNRVYEDVILRARAEGPGGARMCMHRIVPLCLGGSRTAGNTVWLTPRERWITAHLLMRLHPRVRQLRTDRWRKRRQGRSSRAYAVAWNAAEGARRARLSSRGRGRGAGRFLGLQQRANMAVSQARRRARERADKELTVVARANMSFAQSRRARELAAQGGRARV